MLRRRGRVYLLMVLAAGAMALVAWAWFLESMSIARSVSIWRRLFLPRSAEVAGSVVRVPFAYGIVPQDRGVRVLYRFPPLSFNHVTFVLQVQRFRDSTASSGRSKTLARCDTMPTACTTWFADPPANRLPCTEARLDDFEERDPGYFGLCSQPSTGVYGFYGCEGVICGTARAILTDYFRRRTAGSPT